MIDQLYKTMSYIDTDISNLRAIRNHAEKNYQKARVFARNAFIDCRAAEGYLSPFEETLSMLDNEIERLYGIKDALRKELLQSDN